jgi:hypothetical protein
VPEFSNEKVPVVVTTPETLTPVLDPALSVALFKFERLKLPGCVTTEAVALIATGKRNGMR